MKKIIVISVIALLCASVVFAFTKKDLAGLKGTYEGTGTSGGGVTIDVKIEIMNDVEPMEAKLTFSKIPPKVANDYAISDPITGESKDGKLTSTGTVMFTGANGFFEITSVKEKKLTGWGYFKGFKANISATKK
jgi:hypothetical protein